MKEPIYIYKHILQQEREGTISIVSRGLKNKGIPTKVFSQPSEINLTFNKKLINKSEVQK